MNKEKALAKIKKCLALAKSDNVHEAASALRQAQALMAQYSIDYGDVLAFDAAEASIKAGAHRRPPTWEASLVGVVCDAFGCDFVFSMGMVDSRWIIVGIGPKAEIASYAVAVLMRQCKAARAAYIKEKLKRCKRVSKTIRADEFCRGWVGAIKNTVFVFARHEDDTAIIQAYKDRRFGSLGKADALHRETGRNYGDDLNGYRAGKGVVLNQGVAGLGDSKGSIGYGV